MDDALKSRIGGSENFGKINVTSGNFDFIKMAMSPHDLKLIEMGVLTLRQLCSIYGAKSRMFNDPKGSSFNNAKQDGKDFYLNAVLPPLENDLEHWNAFYNPAWNKKDGVTYTVKLDLSSIDVLQEDQDKKIEKSRKIASKRFQIKKATMGGAITIKLMFFLKAFSRSFQGL